MSLDPLLPIAPARVKALLLPLGKIKADRFAHFVDRLRSEHVVHLKDISADGRPNRTMFSPLAYPDGAMFYDLITHVPPPSHLSLTPFDLWREPMAIIAIADGRELQDTAFSKRHSSHAAAPTVIEKNIRALYQELEDVRDNFPKALVHQVMLFDYAAPAGSDIPIPEGVLALPPEEASVRTTIKTAMCDVSALILAEMTTLAKSFEAMKSIDSPGNYSASRHMNGSSEHTANGASRRNSQFALPTQSTRPASAADAFDRSQARMSMPPVPSRPGVGSSNSTPGRPSTPTQDGVQSSSSTPSTPEQKAARPESVGASRDVSRDRVSVHGFGSGGVNDKWRLKGKGRFAILMGSLYLQAGRWGDSLKELSEGAAGLRSLNDHLWHGKALELIVVNLCLLAWSKLEFTVPTVCLPQQDRPRSLSNAKKDPDEGDDSLPKYVRRFQNLLPDLLDRIFGLYSRLSSESLPPLALSETAIRFSKTMLAVHMCAGSLNEKALDMIVLGSAAPQQLTTSPRLLITPTRQQISAMVFKAFPSSATELLTTADRASILSGIANLLGSMGFHRKKAMVIRELVSVLIGGLVEARTRGAADAGVHPAAGLVSLAPGPGQGHGSVALDLSEGDVEQGIEAFLDILCKAYGVVRYDVESKPTTATAKSPDDSSEATIARIQAHAATRLFGFPSIKLNILRACINFSEALPDFNGVLQFSSDLLRTSGSGIAPGPRKEDASSNLMREEQIRLVTNVTRTASLVQKLNLSHLSAEYWDEFLLREVHLEPLPIARVPIPHTRNTLPGASTTRTSQDVNPFIYNPFLKKPDDSTINHNLVAGEIASFRVTLQNPFDVEVEMESIRLCTEGADFESISEVTTIGPYRTQSLRLRGRPTAAGDIKIVGIIAKIRGCRERKFPIFSQAWSPSRELKIKAKGLHGLQGTLEARQATGVPLKPDTVSLQVIQPQPVIVVKSTSLAQSSIMILEGERRTFSVTFQNTSDTAVDFMLFSFKDSTQEQLQTALSKRDATPAELYEYELILAKRQALRLPTSNPSRSIPAGANATFDFEIFGKPGLTSAGIQVDYTYLGKPQDELTEDFFTRQLALNLTVTVNASLELTRLDALPLGGSMPQALWDRLGAEPSGGADEYCLLSMDLRNAWPSQMQVHLEGTDGIVVEENILPGNTGRVILPIKKIFLENPHEAVPTLNPSRNRQFVVSTSKISPAQERINREAFWYREKLLDSLRATWKTTCAPEHSGTVDLRGIRLNSRMIEAIKVDEVDIDLSLETPDSREANVAFVDAYAQVKVRVNNRTSQPISPLIRLTPSLCHRAPNVALDYTRKLAWNGTLQRLLPRIAARGTVEVLIGLTPLCRGQFELGATVEEVKVYHDESLPMEEKSQKLGEEDVPMDVALGVKERRAWHLRQPMLVRVEDRDD